VIVAGWLWLAGVWGPFWFWTVVYAQSYASLVPFAEGLRLLRGELSTLFGAAPALWIIAVAGTAVLGWHPALRRGWFFATGLTAASFAAVCPGWFFREHYFLLLMPAVALLAGVATAGVTEWLADRPLPRLLAAIPTLLVLAGTGQALWAGRAVFFELSPARACRVVYGANPFPESAEIARYLRAHTAPTARIAMIGSEPQIYFYARRRAATPYLYTYPLMEPQPYAGQMQEEFARSIEAADPDYLVFVSVPTSWLIWPGAKQDVFAWFSRYQREHFQAVGIVDIRPDGPSDFRWDDSRDDLRPHSAAWVLVLRNKRLGGPGSR
jgi:hypothetical protein